MNRRAKHALLIAMTLGLAGAWLCPRAAAQETQRLRPGLTAQQTQQAVELARGAMSELRKKTEGATAPEVDRREYIVAVELLAAEPPPANSRTDRNTNPPTEKPRDAAPARKGERPPARPGPLAVVTSYRYLDDLTVFSTIDLGTGRVVDVQAAQHLRSPLSDEEFEEAKTMAHDQSQPVMELFARFGDKLSAYPQFSQYVVKGDLRVHRVIHLTYRVGTKDLSYPRPVVDLTTRRVETPGPEVFPQPRRR
jgi:hypothetical protein